MEPSTELGASERGPSGAGRVLAGLGWATLLIAGGEVLRTPMGVLAARPLLAARALPLEVAASSSRFATTWVAFAGLTLAALAERRAARRRWALGALRVALAALATFGAYRSLTLYPPFAARAPVQIAFALVFALVALAFSGAPAGGRAQRRGFALVTPLAFAGAVAAQLIHSGWYVREYCALHLSLLQLSHLLLATGVWRWLAVRQGSAAGTRRGWLSAVPVGLCAAALALASTRFAAAARPEHRAFSALGLSDALFEPYSPEREVPRAAIADRPDGTAALRAAVHLPPTPGFSLDGRDVLLVLSEATRFDQTSLGSDLRTTPRLERLASEGGFCFTRAYSPASATFLSLSALFGMSYPSLVELETWTKPWTGRLHERERTAAELLREHGYDTFWVGHDHRGSFSRALLGLDAGFSEVALIGGDEERDAHLDQTIADRAIAELEERAQAGRRFFGLVFFVSPHYPYLRHRESAPAGSDLELYRQELGAMDAQLGRLLDALEASPAGQRAVVLFLGDHGEEFGEHGGHQHHSTLYEEALHVPAVLRWPGSSGGRIAPPISSIYLLPWLLTHGAPSLRAEVGARLGSGLAPLLEATGGAVVAETLGHDRTSSALIYPDQAFNYDFIAERYEAYRTGPDPFELEDRFSVDPELAERAIQRVEAYREVRASRRRFELHPEVLDPRDERPGRRGS